jgi:hypothetical protein
VAFLSYGLSFSSLAVVFAACLTCQTALLLALPMKVHTGDGFCDMVLQKYNEDAFIFKTKLLLFLSVRVMGF